jgi:hypothetical protein
MTKKQELAISRMNRALKALSDADIKICGMDDNLLYATQETIDNFDGEDIYCGVANCNRFSEDGSGQFNDHGVYQESGGY